MEWQVMHSFCCKSTSKGLVTTQTLFFQCMMPFAKQAGIKKQIGDAAASAARILANATNNKSMTLKALPPVQKECYAQDMDEG